MTSPSTLCEIAFDDTFGPGVQGCRDNFDFTLLFEQSVMSIGPSILFLLFFSIRIWQLYRQDAKVLSSLLSWMKLGAIGIFAGLQLALLIAWCLPSEPTTKASIASAVFSVIDALAMFILSYTEHIKSPHPSSTLNVYLFFSVLFDIAQARTLWLLHSSHSIAAIFTASLALKSLMLILEAAEKRDFLIGQYQHLAVETTSGIFNRSVFWWLNSMFMRGFRTLMTIDDLFVIEEMFESERLQQKLQVKWHSCDQSEKHSLLFASFSAFKWQFISAICPRICLIGFTFAQPFLINRLIEIVSEEMTEESKRDGYGMIGAAVVIYVGMAVSRCHYTHKTYRFITMLRGALISIIFSKITDLALGAVEDSAAVTLMSTDIDSIATGLVQMHEIWATPIELGIGIYCLQRQVGLACMLVTIPAMGALLMSQVAKYIGPYRVLWNQAIQERVSATSSVLNQMKGVKLLGLTAALETNIQSLRNTELNKSRKYRWMIVWLNVIGNMSEQFTSVVVIAGAIFWSADRQALTVAQAFTTLSIIALVSFPLTTLLSQYPNIIAAASCFDRIRKYLTSKEKEDHRLLDLKSTSESHNNDSWMATMPFDQGIELEEIRCPQTDTKSKIFHRDILRVEEGTFGMRGDGTPILNNINIRFPKSSFTMIIGPIGSGKSTFIKSILGEIPSSKGFVRVASVSAAYCDQTSWLVNTTVRENILGESEFDPQWYSTVLHVCMLYEDLAQFPQGHDSLVGSGGISLSGGQKQRIALARALYSRRPLVILDDIFSGLDNNTASAVWTRLFDREGLFKRLGTTVILATHAVHSMQSADKIVVLDSKGIISQQGRFKELQSQPGYIQNLLLQEPTSLDATETIKEVLLPPVQSVGLKPRKTESLDMKRKTGDLSVYKYYFKSLGWRRTMIFILTEAICVILFKLPQIWLRIWTENSKSSMLGVNFAIYTAISVLSPLEGGFSIFYFLVHLVQISANYLHQILLTTVMRAPYSFFSTTDSGVTLNRFSQDMSLIDSTLPIAAFTTVFDGFCVIAEIAIIASGASYIAAMIPFCLFAVYILQAFYLRTSRQIRFLDLEAKSPLYTHFTETLSGLATIRAFGWQTAFQNKNLNYLDTSQRPHYLLYCIQRWLNLVLDLFVAGMALVLVAFATQFRSTTSSGAIGLAMINVLNFNLSLSRFITSWTTLETSLGAIARLKDFVHDTPSEGRVRECDVPPANWPERGDIDIRDVSVSYKSDAGPVLNNLFLKIEYGQKIGVCGRTGSGKSSLILTLLRLLDLDSGSIYIDSVDISTVPRQTLRSRLVVIPQEPVTMPGSLRYNLDPSHSSSDETIITTLHKLALCDIIASCGGLDTDMETLSLSHGQRQLLCLGIAMLRKSSIVILDEATSNVDPETDNMMQRVIREHFRECTVIAVAHRLGTIMDFDRIVVLDRGRIVEYGEPGELLARRRAFWELVRGGNL